MPDFDAYDHVVDHALPIIADRVDELRLRERVADDLTQTTIPVSSV
jgi:hypothetical protein